jgi:hypothetical protein
MQNITAAYTIDWALSIIASPLFRAILFVLWIISLVGVLLRFISIGQFIRTTVSLLLIAFIPQLYYFFQSLLLFMFHP